MEKVYFDSAATTQLRSEVVDCMSDVLKNEYGNDLSLEELREISDTDFGGLESSKRRKE